MGKPKIITQTVFLPAELHQRAKAAAAIASTPLERWIGAVLEAGFADTPKARRALKTLERIAPEPGQSLHDWKRVFVPVPKDLKARAKAMAAANGATPVNGGNTGPLAHAIAGLVQRAVSG